MKNIVYGCPNLCVRYAENNMESRSFQVEINYGDPLAELGKCDG